MRKKPALTIVEDEDQLAREPQPPFGEAGTKLYEAMLDEFDFSSARDLETLAQICSAADRAEDCARIIKRDGAVIETKHGLKDHPLLRHEGIARAFVVRSLHRLKAELEPGANRGVGRPGTGGVGITWRQMPGHKGE